MKALSLTQPWASLVTLGAKQVETRSWATNYRGLIAIHAAKGFPRDAKEICGTRPFKTVLGDAGLAAASLPLGAVIATARLVDVRLIDIRVRAHIIAYGAPCEIDFGDYTSGRYAWFFEDVQRLAVPIPAKGSLGLWDWAMPSPAVPAAVPAAGA